MRSSITYLALKEVECLDREIAAVLENKGFIIQACEITVRHGGRLQLYVSYAAEGTSLSGNFFVYGDIEGLTKFMDDIRDKLRPIRSVEQAQVKDATEKVAAALEAVKDLDDSDNYDMSNVRSDLYQTLTALNGRLLTYEGSTDDDDTIDF